MNETIIKPKKFIFKTELTKANELYLLHALHGHIRISVFKVFIAAALLYMLYKA